MGLFQDSAVKIINHFEQHSNTTTLTTLAVGLILYFLYTWAVRPLNRICRLGDLGLYFDAKLKGKYKERQLERLIKLRRVGDLPPVFPNGWYCVAESDQINPGEIKEITVFGQFVSLVRSQSGKVFIMESYCPHLGANFNVVNDNCVQCPFHGWIFSAETGKCAKIPYNDNSIPEQAKVATWPAVEKNKHIYIWFHCDGDDPEWEVPDIEKINSGEWSYGGRTEHEIMCHCQEIPENGADIAHLNYLHLSGPNRADILNFDLNDTKPMIQHCWTGSWEHGAGDMKHLGIMYLDQYLTFYGQKIPLTASKLRAEQFGPGIVVMNFDFGPIGSGVVLQHVTPEEPLLQRVRFKMYSTCPLWFCKFFLISEATQFERDIYIWSNKKYIRHPIVVKNDGPILKHRRWYSQFYSKNSPRMLSNGEITNKPQSINDW